MLLNGPDTGKEAKKARPLMLLRLLARYSDEEHPLAGAELCSFLGEGGCGCDVKTVYRDIAALRKTGADILFTRKPRPGYFLGKRTFELPEVRLLVDAVLAAPFITLRKTEELTGKLRALMSEGQAEEMMRQVCFEKRVKFDNEEIYYSIDAIERAISSGKKLAFFYRHMHIARGRVEPAPGRRFVVSPYALLWDSDRYYLAGNYEKYDGIGNYRLDRMRGAEVLRENARPFREVCEYRDYFDTADYIAKTFQMYHGEKMTVELRCSAAILESMLDRFGAGMRILCSDELSFTIKAEVREGEGFERWLLQFGSAAEVLSPQSLRDRMAGKAEALAVLYGTTKKTCDR